MAITHLSPVATPAGPGPTEIQLNNVHFSYGKHEVLKDVSLSVPRGEICGLLGPNGSGKSTLLTLLCGLAAPSTGSIALRGKPLIPLTRKLRASLGVVFQSVSLDDKLTARQNLMLAARIQTLPTAEHASKVNEMLEAAGLSDRADDPVSAFSGGMKRRLDISRALLSSPPILLLDEPSAGLDEAAFRAVWAQLLAMRNERGLTILVSSHRPDESEYCDRLAVLSKGSLIRMDSPEALRREISSDILQFEGNAPEEIAAKIAEITPWTATVEGTTVELRCEEGHVWIPRIIQELPTGAIQAVSLRKPSLADVFLELTGAALQDEAVTS